MKFRAFIRKKLDFHPLHNFVDIKDANTLNQHSQKPPDFGEKIICFEISGFYRLQSQKIQFPPIRSLF